MRLVAENVTVARDGQLFFSGIGFTLDEGESLVVSGPNGVGKSTLLRVLAGLLPDVEGRVSIDDARYERAAEACHYLGHRNGMKHALSVGENLTFWQRFLRTEEDRPPSPDIGHAAAAVGLAGLEHLPYGYLSAGQQRRMAMARLLLSWRPVWILDEPTAALDTHSQALFADLVARHLGDGGIVIAATHQPLGFASPHRLLLEPNAPPVFAGSDAVTSGADA